MRMSLTLKWQMHVLPTLRIGRGVTADWQEKKFFLLKNTHFLSYRVHSQVQETERAENHGKPKQNRSTYADY